MSPVLPIAGLAFLAWKYPEQTKRLAHNLKTTRVWRTVDALRRLKKFELSLDLGLTVRINDMEFRQGFRASGAAESMR